MIKFSTRKIAERFTNLIVMRFSRNQIIGAIVLLAIIWLVVAIRLIISRG